MGLQSNSSQTAATYDQAKFNFVGHDFHDIPQGLRSTIRELARRKVLGRLLEFNHARYEEGVKMGLHSKKRAKDSKQWGESRPQVVSQSKK